eukprot:GHVU01091575.1.p2 GENE.GHVU01091575.1~~GHVU01091575.1.p2  ORF type:complete len:104 (-),score=13.03 GHVU01091575.1:638-949(-)
MVGWTQVGVVGKEETRGFLRPVRSVNRHFEVHAEKKEMQQRTETHYLLDQMSNDIRGSSSTPQAGNCHRANVGSGMGRRKEYMATLIAVKDSVRLRLIVHNED